MEFRPLNTAALHSRAHSLAWLTGTLNRMEPLLMSLVTPVPALL